MIGCESTADVSFRAQRSFTLPDEKARISLSAEIFNLLDFDNVEIGSSQMTYGPGPAAVNPNFGLVRNPQTGQYFSNSTLRTSPFQAQLGLRVRF